MPDRPSTTRSMVRTTLVALGTVAALCAVLGLVGVWWTDDGAGTLQGALEALCWIAAGMGSVGALPASARKLGPMLRQDVDP